MRDLDLELTLKLYGQQDQGYVGLELTLKLGGQQDQGYTVPSALTILLKFKSTYNFVRTKFGWIYLTEEGCWTFGGG